MDDSAMDKEWARKYILDPLTAPEPSQETGIGSSHINQLRQLSISPSKQANEKYPARIRSPIQQVQQPPARLQKNSSNHRKTSSYPTPPASASPSRDSFHPSNPFSNTARLDTHEELISPPASPSPRSAVNNPRRYPPNSANTRSSSAQSPPPQRPRPHHNRSFSDGNVGLQRSSSLNQRYPGDMSHRPLDIIKKETRAADRAPHLRRKHMPPTDVIDALDTIGGTYHHGGPYDATLASRNTNVKYPPLEAVHDTNLEAIRATPREYMQDSLERHMPLQGTAIIPNGAEDMRGQKIYYTEGADLMREPDAAGGAYKRWDGIRYHPDDLKGKGEPSYTLERDLKEKKRYGNGKQNEYEMQTRPPVTHHRSFSNETPGSGYSNSSDLQRSNTTGKRLSDGLKRRFGSIRRKKVAIVE